MALAKELVGVGISPMQSLIIPNGVPSAVTAAGSTQADGTVIAAGFNRVTGADGTKGVTLPAANPGESVVIVNDTSSTLKVYPPVGAAIGIPGTSFGSASANTAYSQTTFTVVQFICYSSTLWAINKSA